MAVDLPADALLANSEGDNGAAHIHEQGRLGARKLFSVLGVDEDDGAYVLIIGIIFMGIMVIGCCYCKVYDPTKIWCAKKYKRYCTRRPKAPKQPRPPTPPAEEVSNIDVSSVRCCCQQRRLVVLSTTKLWARYPVISPITQTPDLAQNLHDASDVYACCRAAPVAFVDTILSLVTI